MGRKDAVQFTLEWAARARALGATVTFQSGWENRGNGTSADYEGAIVHHTASNSNAVKINPTLSILISGRSDLPGPLCNVTGPWCTAAAPLLHVVAAHPANHAGASGGRSMGPLPVTSLFNKRVFGLEIDYAGSSPMTDGQHRASLIFARAVADVLGRSTEYVRAHAESSITGKWDPGYASGKTIDMGAFRRDAANLTNSAGDDSMSAADVADLKAWMNAKVGRPFFGLRNSPDMAAAGWPKGDGAMVIAAPGFWFPLADPGFIGLYQGRGLVGDFVDVPPNEFAHYKSLFLAPISGNVDNGKLAAELREMVSEAEAIQTAELLVKLGTYKPVETVATAPATPIPLTSAQLKELAGYLAPALAPGLADEWDKRARDNDSKTGPVT